MERIQQPCTPAALMYIYTRKCVSLLHRTGTVASADQIQQSTLTGRLGGPSCRLDQNSSYSKERRNSAQQPREGEEERLSNEDRATNSSWSHVLTTNKGTHWVTVTQYHDASIRLSLGVTFQLFAPRLHNQLHELGKAANQQAALRHRRQRGLI